MMNVPSNNDISIEQSIISEDKIGDTESEQLSKQITPPQNKPWWIILPDNKYLLIWENLLNLLIVLFG